MLERIKLVAKYALSFFALTSLLHLTAFYLTKYSVDKDNANVLMAALLSATAVILYGGMIKMTIKYIADSLGKDKK